MSKYKTHTYNLFSSTLQNTHLYIKAQFTNIFSGELVLTKALFIRYQPFGMDFPLP